MTNKSRASTNLLPIFIIVGLIIVAGFLLTKDDFDPPWKSSNNVKAVHLQNFPREVPTLEQVDKVRKVVDSQEELDALLKKIDPTGSTKVNEKVNFDKEILIVATSETVKTDGYELKIRKIYNIKEKDEFQALIKLTKPGKTCEVQQVSNVVMDIVKIKKTDKNIDFKKEEGTEECGDIEPQKDEESTPSEGESTDGGTTTEQEVEQ